MKSRYSPPDYSELNEQDKQILDKAAKIMSQLREKGLVEPSPIDSDLVYVTVTDEEDEILSKADQILRPKYRY